MLFKMRMSFFFLCKTEYKMLKTVSIPFHGI